MKRSYLFVPGNRSERFGKAIACGAGVVILDLEDAVPPEGKSAARDAVCRWLSENGAAAWVRRTHQAGCVLRSRHCLRCASAKFRAWLVARRTRAALR